MSYRTLLAIALSASVAAQTSYQLTEIVAPPGQLVEARDLNDAGVVVGRVYPPGGRLDSQAFVWARGALALLPSPPGPRWVAAAAVDEAGRIYGELETAPNSRRYLPLLWQAGQLFAVPTVFQNVSQRLLPSPSGRFIATNSLPFDDPTPGWKNQFGWIDEPDFTNTSGDDTMPMVFDLRAGTFTITGSFAGGRRPVVAAISDTGFAACTVTFGGWNHSTAVRWDRTQGAVLVGTGGRRGSIATGVNASGAVVGYLNKTGTGNINTDVRKRAFAWRVGVTTELPVPPAFEHSQANGINDRNVVVGSFGASPTNPFQNDGAWVWANGTLTDLNTVIPAGSGWSLTNAIAINNAGQILVADQIGPGFLDSRFALLTPQ